MSKLEEVLGYHFANPSLLEEALTHPSYAHENNKPSYERLEFLGDSVLNLVLVQKLFHLFPQLTPGKLSKLRSHLVSRCTLSSIAFSIHLWEEIYLGIGEEKGGGRKRPSILASVLEAILGAIFLDGGLKEAEEVINKLFAQELKKIAQGQFPRDYKSELQELLLAQGIYPEYRILQSQGPDHDKKFAACILAGGTIIGTGEGGSKKAATIKAAQQALLSFQRGDKINSVERA